MSDNPVERDPLLAALLRAQAAREPVALLLVTSGPPQWLGLRVLVWEQEERDPLLSRPAPGFPLEQAAAQARSEIQSGIPRLVEVASSEGPLALFVEVQAPPVRLVICGAGHIAAPLAAMASLCDFEVTVLDDRAQYATAARFPGARVLVDDFRRGLAGLRAQGALNRRACLVLVTRGHQHDVDCLLEVIDDPLAYVGMIGSRRRIRAVFDLLEREQGLDTERLARVHAPIGLDIGARTPAEIAVAILGEIINTLRGGPAEGLGATLQRERTRLVHKQRH